MLRTQSEDVKTRRAALTVLQGFAPLEQGPQPAIDTGERLTLTADDDLERATLLAMRAGGPREAMIFLMGIVVDAREPAQRRIVALDDARYMNEARR